MNSSDDVVIVLNFDGVERLYVPSSGNMPNIEVKVFRNGDLSSHRHYSLIQMDDGLVLCGET